MEVLPAMVVPFFPLRIVEYSRSNTNIPCSAILSRAHTRVRSRYNGADGMGSSL